METKIYNDEPKLNEETMEKLAKAYAVAFDVVKNDTESPTTERLLSEILSEIKLIRENQEKQRRIRLS